MQRRHGLIGLGSWEGQPYRQGIFAASTLPPLPDLGQLPSCQPCPAGTYGCGPSYCYAPPTQVPVTQPPPSDTQPTQVTCPAGTTLVGGQCVGVVPGISTQPAEQPKPSWWSQRTDTEKWMVVGGGVLAAVALLSLLRGASHREVYSQNLRAPRRRRARGLVRIGGKPWGGRRPPAKYRRQGATRASDYAYPDRFKYPLVFRGRGGKVNRERSRRHVWAAKGYFTKYKRRYPMGIRRTIARNINRAARRFGLRPNARP